MLRYMFPIVIINVIVSCQLTKEEKERERDLVGLMKKQSIIVTCHIFWK